MTLLRYNKDSKDVDISQAKRLNKPTMQARHSAISKRIGGGWIKSHYPPFFISFLPQ